MLCRRARDWIGLSLDGMLPPDRTVALTEHLAGCDGCRAYREEVRLGQRLLAATAPRLSDNFEWRLQLKLNQTLQEAAREATSPWEAPDRGWRGWWQGAALAATGGLAVVLLTSALLLRGGGPVPVATRPVAAPAPTVVAAAAEGRPTPVGTVTSTAGDASRTSFSQFGLRSRFGDVTRSDVTGRPVPSYGAAFGREGWTDTGTQSLATIARLRDQNLRLRDQLAQAQHEIYVLRAQARAGAAARPDSVPAVRR